MAIGEFHQLVGDAVDISKATAKKMHRTVFKLQDVLNVKRLFYAIADMTSSDFLRYSQIVTFTLKANNSAVFEKVHAFQPVGISIHSYWPQLFVK